ncbi:MAG: HAD family hydrolase [Planctomycetes bacterium]|nr:HAD family hydrolase [Planctomycetota bacterium]
MTNPRRPAAFLDRDGTLVHDDGYMSRPEQLRPMRNAAYGIRRLIALGFVPVVVTNQSGVGRGLITRAQMARMTDRLRRLFAERGVRFAGVYVCPHHPDDGCACRKPKAGLLTRAARELKLDLKRSVMIGDSDRDVVAGRTVGARTILVGRKAMGRPSADHVARDLIDAARWLSRTASRRSSRTTLPRP